MRFKTSVRNISTFTKLTQSLTPIGKTAWLRLSEDEVRFVINAPEGTQVWATLSIPTLFEDYRISSANSNIINLEVPLTPLHRALRSCASASDAVLRLTKRASDGVPVLCLTITTASTSTFLSGSTLVTQEVPVRVLSAASVESVNEPQTPEADVLIYLPPLGQLRAIVDRFNRLSSFSSSDESRKLTLSANMDGEFKMAVNCSGEVKVETKWRDLQNPQLAGGTSVEPHPSTRREKKAFASVRVDGREWAKVLKVGALARRVVACFCEDLTIVLYVFLTEDEDPDQTILTYYIASYST